jgi:transposase
LPEGHLALFVSDVVDELDLRAITSRVGTGDPRGRAGYHPRMLTKLLVYGYCTGKTSSRKLERATYDEVAFRVLAGDQHPDHDCIAAFRKDHLVALGGLFAQVLLLCQKAGLVKLGHVAIDGTKVKANASKHKAMSYGRMGEAERRLQAEVERLLAEAERVDAEEDARFGRGKRGDELPAELARRESRLKKIRAAKAELEQEAREEAERAAAQAQAKLDKRNQQEAQTGKKVGGRPPQVKDPAQAKPDDKAQRNFTDPQSRIMKDGASKGFEQAYNAQIAVDSQAQIIVAAAVTQETNDKRQLVPMLAAVAQNVGALPAKASADAGYFSEEAIAKPQLAPVSLHVPPDRLKHADDPPQDAAGKPRAPASEVAAAMREKLTTDDGRATYKLRKAIVEPVFGQIKEVRGFRRFSLRGLAAVQGEWLLVSLAHNLLKLYRHGGPSLAYSS